MVALLVTDDLIFNIGCCTTANDYLVFGMAGNTTTTTKRTTSTTMQQCLSRVPSSNKLFMSRFNWCNVYNDTPIGDQEDDKYNPNMDGGYLKILFFI